MLIIKQHVLFCKMIQNIGKNSRLIRLYDQGGDEMRDAERRLEEWIRSYGNELLRMCFVLLSDAAQAEDAVQDTFLRAWRSMEQFEGRNGCSEKTWLVKIAVNVCRDYRRMRWFRHVDLSKSLEDLPPHMVMVAPEDRMLMLDILRLPQKEKQVLLLYYYQGLTLEETAQTLGMSRSTVHHRLKRAKAMLRDTLAGGDVDEK